MKVPVRLLPISLTPFSQLKPFKIFWKLKKFNHYPQTFQGFFHCLISYLLTAVHFPNCSFKEEKGKKEERRGKREEGKKPTKTPTTFFFSSLHCMKWNTPDKRDIKGNKFNCENKFLFTAIWISLSWNSCNFTSNVFIKEFNFLFLWLAT